MAPDGRTPTHVQLELPWRTGAAWKKVVSIVASVFNSGRQDITCKIERCMLVCTCLFVCVCVYSMHKSAPIVRNIFSRLFEKLVADAAILISRGKCIREQ